MEEGKRRSIWNGLGDGAALLLFPNLPLKGKWKGGGWGKRRGRCSADKIATTFLDGVSGRGFTAVWMYLLSLILCCVREKKKGEKGGRGEGKEF